jgi:uncharacterized protein Yka (UPF0111/DUF47 family)
MSFILSFFQRFFSSSDNKINSLLGNLFVNLQEMSMMLQLLSVKKNKTEQRALTVRIQELENKTHECSRLIITQLDSHFLTDISREDIIAVARTADKIAENIMEVCNTIDFYLENHDFTPEMVQLCETIHDSICTMRICFKHLQKPVSKIIIKSTSNKIESINKKAEKSYREIKGNLLSSLSEPVNRIKINEWLNQLNEITEQSVEMNYIFERILVKK